MKRLSVLLVLLLFFSIIPLPIESFHSESPKTPDFAPGELIVKFRQGNAPEIPSDISGKIQEMRTMRIQFVDSLPIKTNGKIYRIKIDENSDIISAAKELMKNPDIEYAEPNYVLRTFEVPNDPNFTQQWSLNRTNASLGWDIATGNSSVIIAIIDTGVDWDHPDLAANIWNNTDETPDNSIDDDSNNYTDDVRGWDFVDDTTGTPYTCTDDDCDTADNNPMDFNGHGTHCAGVAGAVTNNSVGVAGVCRNCTIMPLRAGWDCDSGYGCILTSDAAEAVAYAADNGAKVISMSFGYNASTQTLKNAIDYAYGKGAVILAASGNTNEAALHYPAAYDNVIAVTATKNNDARADYSNYGYWTDVSAPGGYGTGASQKILSTVFDDSYDTMQGTSMACPFVAGLAGLILSKNSTYTPLEVETIILSSTDPLTSSYYIGTGRVNVLKALERNYTNIAKLSQGLDNLSFFCNVTGGFQINSGSNKTFITEDVDSIISALNSSNLPDILASHDFTHNNSNTITYDQRIKFDSSTPLTINYGTPGGENEPVLYTTFGTNNRYNLEVIFNGGLNTSAVEAGQNITLFGMDYVFSEDNVTNSTITLFKLSSSHIITLEYVGDTETVIMQEGSYKFELKGYGSDNKTAYLYVNDAPTSTYGWEEGNTYTIGTSKVYVKDVSVIDDGEGGENITVVLIAGTDKLKLIDSSAIEKNDVALVNTDVEFNSSGEIINSLLLTIAPDIDTYMTESNEFVDPVFGSFKFSMHGMSKPVTSPARDLIQIYRFSNTTASLNFTSKNGSNYSTGVYYYNSTGWEAKINSTSRFWYFESNISGGEGNLTNNISVGDYFVLTNYSSLDSCVYKYDGYYNSTTPEENYVNLTDVSTGITSKIYLNTSNTSLVAGTSAFNVSWINGSYGTNYAIGVDMNGNGIFSDTEKVEIYTRLGAKIVFSSNPATMPAINVTENPQYSFYGNEPILTGIGVNASYASYDIGFTLYGNGSSTLYGGQIGFSNSYRYMTRYGTYVETDTDADTVKIYYSGKTPSYAIFTVGGYTASNSSFAINGTANGTYFSNYSLFYGEGFYPSSWSLINSSNVSKSNQTLFTWNPGSIANGTYSIRLVANDTFNVTTEDKAIVHLSNSIYNYDPVVENVLVECDDPLNRTNGTLTAYYDFYDVENTTVINSTKWFRNGIEQTGFENQTQIPAENTTKHDVWIFSAGAFDGYAWMWMNSSPIDIANTPPSIPELVSPVIEANISNSTVSFTWNSSTDMDNDTISYILYAISSETNYDHLTVNNYTSLSMADGFYNWTVTANDGDILVESARGNFTKDSTPPSITTATSHTIAINFTNISLAANFTDAHPGSIWLNITLPTLETILLPISNNTPVDFQINNTGDYTATFYANDTFGNNASSVRYIRAENPMNFSVNVVGYNLAGLSANVTITYNNTQVTRNATSGGYANSTIPNYTYYEVKFEALSNNLTVLLRNINASRNTNKTMGFDKTSSSTYFAIYAVNNTYLFSTADVNMSYGSGGYLNENYFGFYRCSSWNFQSRTCSVSWENITSSVSQNTALDAITLTTNSFSAFAIKQELYCGNAVCDNNETCSSCSVDCGACPPSGSIIVTGGATTTTTTTVEDEIVIIRTTTTLEETTTTIEEYQLSASTTTIPPASSNAPPGQGTDLSIVAIALAIPLIAGIAFWMLKTRKIQEMMESMLMSKSYLFKELILLEKEAILAKKEGHQTERIDDELVLAKRAIESGALGSAKSHMDNARSLISLYKKTR